MTDTGSGSSPISQAAAFPSLLHAVLKGTVPVSTETERDLRQRLLAGLCPYVFLRTNYEIISSGVLRY